MYEKSCIRDVGRMAGSPLSVGEELNGNEENLW